MEQSTLSADYLIYSPVSASVIIEQKKDYSVGFVLCRFLFMPERFFLLLSNFEMST